MPREDMRLKAVRLRGRARSRRRGGFGFPLGPATSIGIHWLVRFLLWNRRRFRGDNFGFLFARPEERSAGQNADQFFHSLD